MFKTIALALDGSEGSRRAIPVAAGLAQQDHAKIVVVHVEEDVARVGGPVDLDEPEIQAVVREQAKELSDQGIETSVVMAKTMISGPAKVIADAADEAHADLIVTGSRGHTPLQGLLLGSVVERLIHLAHRPLLIVPPSES